MTSAVSERRSPPFPGATHARRDAPASPCGARTWWYRLHSLGHTHPGSGKRASESRSGGHKRSASSGAQRGGLKPPVLGPRASDAGKCPHPGNPRRTAAAATRSGRQNGGGSDGLVLRGEPGPRDPASGRAGRPQPPGVCPRPAPSRTRSDARGPGGRAPGRRGAGPRARSGCPEASPSPAGRSGAGAAGGARAPRESLSAGRWPAGPTPIPAGGGPGAAVARRAEPAGSGPDWADCADRSRALPWGSGGWPHPAPQGEPGGTEASEVRAGLGRAGGGSGRQPPLPALEGRGAKGGFFTQDCTKPASLLWPRSGPPVGVHL